MDPGKCLVYMLDGNVQSYQISFLQNLTSQEFYDICASQIMLHERRYFSLCYFDKSGNKHWLQMNRRVMEHDFGCAGFLEFHFQVKFFVEHIGFLQEGLAIVLFYRQCKQFIADGSLFVDSPTAFLLSGYVLQEQFGDYDSHSTARAYLKDANILPQSCYEEHLSVEYCEDAVIESYQQLMGTSRSEIIHMFMDTVCRLPNYGVHYYRVTEKSQMPWVLGISRKGIAQYDMNDTVTPRKQFTWSNIAHLLFRDRKFTVDLHSSNSYNPVMTMGKRSSIKSGAVHSWYAKPTLIRTIYNLATEMHAFSESWANQPKHIILQKQCHQGPMLDLQSDLGSSQSINSSSGFSDVDGISSSTGRSVSQNFSSLSGTSDLGPSLETLQDMVKALTSRRDMLVDQLTEKLEQLKKVCMEEAQLTGKLPSEYPLAPGEAPPVVQKLVKTSYKYSDQFLLSLKKGHDERQKLETEIAVQSNLVNARRALLADSKGVSRKMKKSREEQYRNNLSKLETLKNRLAELNTYRENSRSVDDLLNEEPSSHSTPTTPTMPRRQTSHPSSVMEYASLPRAKSLAVRHETPSPCSTGGYIPGVGYKSAYRRSQYPTFSSRHSQEDLLGSPSSKGSSDDLWHQPASSPRLPVPYISPPPYTATATHGIYNLSTRPNQPLSYQV